jgi:hypothetical protein
MLLLLSLLKEILLWLSMAEIIFIPYGLQETRLGIRSLPLYLNYITMQINSLWKLQIFHPELSILFSSFLHMWWVAE